MLVLMIEKLLGPHDKYTNRLNHHIKGTNKRKVYHIMFIAAVIFAMFFSEFVLAFSTPHQPLMAYAYFLDDRSGGNAVANALGKLTITEDAHLLIKGSGRYTIRIEDSQSRVLFSKAGLFNRTGYAEVVFTLSPSKFRVGESYYAHITAEDNPFPLFYRYAEAKISFKVHRDYPVIGLGAVGDGNQTVITARILTGAGPLKNKKIWFAYKRYNENETLKPIGFAFSDEEGRAAIATEMLNESRLYLIVAEFYGDELYKPAAASQPYTPMITLRDYAKHDTLLSIINGTGTAEKNENSRVVTPKQMQTVVQKSSVGRAVLSGASSYKADMITGERFRKVTASDRIKSNLNSPKFEFIEDDLASLTLVEFLKRITTDDTPASALINIANILMNLDNVPFVIEQTQELLSKLQVPLVPDIAHSSLTEIRLYRTKTYVVNVEKTIAEKHVETYTVTKKVSKKVKYTEKVTKKIKVRVQYIYYQKIVRKEMAFVRRPRPHWQIVYVATYKPIIKWKYVWKTVTYTVTRYKTIWSTVTETKTRVYYTYKTVTDKVKKEKREYFRILITEGFTVVNEQTNEKMSLQQFFLFIVGFREDVLGQIIRYLEAKIFGPALDILQEFLDFLIGIGKRFLSALIDHLVDTLKNLVIQGFMVHMKRKRGTSSGSTSKSSGGYSLYEASKSEKYKNIRLEPADRLANGEPLDRPFNAWDPLSKLHAPQEHDLAETTKLTVMFDVVRGNLKKAALGEEHVIVVPGPTEELVYNPNFEENGQPDLGWLDLNKYDHTFATDDSFGYIPLGVRRTTYIILIPDGESLYGRKMQIAYSLDYVDDNTRLVPESLKSFVETTKNKEKFKNMAHKLSKELEKLERLLGEVETYGELRESIAERYNINLEERIDAAVKRVEMSGSEIASVESGGSRTRFFIIEDAVKFKTSSGEEITYYPWKLDYKNFLKETGKKDKYRAAKDTAIGILGEEFFKKYKETHEVKANEGYYNDALREAGFDFASTDSIKPLFKKICEVAEKNDISAGGIIRLIGPSIIEEAKREDGKIVKYLGESDEFQKADKAMTIVNPATANSFAVLFLDYYRGFQKGLFEDLLRKINDAADYRTVQLRIFQMSIADAYRVATLYNGDPAKIEFEVRYKVGGKVESSKVTLEFLMSRIDEFQPNSKIEIDGTEIPVVDFVEGATRVRMVQDTKNKKVVIQLLDENLNPIEEESSKPGETKYLEETYELERAGKRWHMKLSADSAIREKQIDMLGTFGEKMKRLTYEALSTCYDELVKETPELKPKFGKILGEAEYFGRDPRKTAENLIFYALRDTKMNDRADDRSYYLMNRYTLKLAEEEIRTSQLIFELSKEVKNDPEKAQKLQRLVSELKGDLKNIWEKPEDTILAPRTFKVAEKKGKKGDIDFKKVRDTAKLRYEIIKSYILHLFGCEDDVKKFKDRLKQSGSTVLSGAIVGLIFPATLGTVITTLAWSVIEESLAKHPKMLFALLTDENVRTAIGLSLSAISFALLNLDVNRFIKAADAGSTAHSASFLGGIKGQIKTASAKSTAHSASFLGEVRSQLFDMKMIAGSFLTAIGMMLSGLFKSPFYTTEEIMEALSEQVHENLGETAGHIWDAVAGYKVPGVEMTVFEIALMLLFQGSGGTIFQLIITGLTKAIEALLARVIEPVVMPIIEEHAYYIADAILLD